MTGLGEGSESFLGSTSGSGGLDFFLIGFGLEDYFFKRSVKTKLFFLFSACLGFLGENAT